MWYIDSDDWLKDENVLMKINNELKYAPDVLFVGMAKYQNGHLENPFIPEYENRYEAMQGWSGSCAMVIKKELAIRQECLYNEGTLKEDRNHHYKICIYMNDFRLLKEVVYIWNRTNTKSVTTIRRKNILWETSTIRNYADIKELYLTFKGQDAKIDKILLARLELAKEEIMTGGDRQH